MRDCTMVGPGVVVTALDGAAEVIEGGAVVWEGDRILEVGPFADLSVRHVSARLVNARQGLILPGFVNCHHHLYSALARGLDPGAPAQDFGAVLDRLWWRLDRALDADTIRLSAALGLADCIRWGTTTVFDHHASPTFLEGSLGIIAGEVERAGLAAVLCYEVSDRNNHAEALAGVEENLAFARSAAARRGLHGMLGLHASFTLADATLREVARRRPDGMGVHIHLAEDVLDGVVSRERFGRTPLERLEDHGLLDRNALLAHGVHLERAELERIAAAEATIIHNPESNAHNGVGRLDLQRAAACRCAVGLGTDGMSSSMPRALRAAFLTLRGATADPSTGLELGLRLLAVNAACAGRLFGEPLLGRLAAGAPADLMVVDPSPTPVTTANLAGHLVYGVAESPVRHTVARGKVLLEDHRHTTLDVEALAAAAREVTPGLWSRFHELGRDPC